MSKQTVRKKHGWLAVVTTAGLALATSSALLAQTAGSAVSPSSTSATASPAATSTSDVTKMAQLVVTGSSIPDAGQALSIPVAVVTPDQIQNSGEDTNLLDILRKISPAITGIGGENATLATANTLGGSMAQIHDLPTLVLVNGHRMAYDPADAGGGLEFVDLNSIPTAAIDRVEVLSDGSSAIYGSDAVGGVINVILKKDYNSWEVNAHYGYSDTVGHYNERTGSIVGGVSNGTTSITVSAEYSENPPIYESTRNYTNPFYGTTYIPGIVEVFGLASSYDEAFLLNPKYNAPPGGGTYTMSQLVSMGVYTDLGSFNDPGVLAKVQSMYNLANNETLAESLKRQAATIDFEHKVFGDQLVAFGDILYSHVDTESKLNAQPLFPYISDTNSDLGVYGVTPPASGTEYVPVTAATNPFSQAWMDQGYTDGSGGYGVLVHNRFISNPRTFQNDNDSLRVEAGLKGQIGDSWTWQGVAGFSRVQDGYTNGGLLDTNNLIAAFVNGTLNPFAYTQSASGLDGVLGSAFVNYTSTLNVFDLEANGPVFTLPAGKVNVALGGEFQREGLSAVPDNNSANDLWVDSPTILPFDQNRQVESAYGELEVPLLSPAQGVRGIYTLNLDGALRYDYYKKVGTSTVPKIDVKYQPFDDQLTLRASAGKSFLAPTLYDLYGPVTQGSSNVITYNGANGVTYNEVQFQDVSGSNPKLQPSKADEWSAGFVLTPKAVRNLSFTFDFYDVVQHGLIGSIDQATIVQSVENLGAASPYASYVHFGSATGPGPSGNAAGQISDKPLAEVYLVTPDVNLGANAEKFFDTSIDYIYDAGRFGEFDFAGTVTAYSSYLIQELPTQNYYQYAGHVSTNAADVSGVGGTVPRWRTYVSEEWKFHGFDVLAAQTFVPSVTDIGSGGSNESPPLHVPAYVQYDFAVGYKFTNLRWVNGMTVRVGVNNAFNYQPPVAPYDLQETLADIGTYGGAVGRIFYVDASYKF